MLTSSPARPMDVSLGTVARPSWRGGLHLIGLIAAVPLTVILAVFADGAGARSGVIVYAIGLCSMLAVSVTYHRWVHTLRARAIWRRADHATIYAAIGGTFTPLCLLALGTIGRIVLLAVVWGAGVIGATIKAVGWRHAHRVGAVLYLGLGWSGVLLIPALWRHSGVLPVALLFVGGVFYTVGAIAFSRQWPKLGPSVFSYHEVWHCFTLAAAGAQFAAIWMVAA